MALHRHEMKAGPPALYSSLPKFISRENELFLRDQTCCGPEDNFIYLCNCYYGRLNIILLLLLKCKKKKKNCFASFFKKGIFKPDLCVFGNSLSNKHKLHMVFVFLHLLGPSPCPSCLPPAFPLGKPHGEQPPAGLWSLLGAVPQFSSQREFSGMHSRYSCNFLSSDLSCFVSFPKKKMILQF